MSDRPIFMLDAQRIADSCPLADIEYHPVIGSTNDRALQLAADPSLALPLLVVADRQTAGRGRGSNRWWTGEGSLAFSLLWTPPPKHRRTPLGAISLASGLAIIDAVAPRLGARPLGLHWPNDVFVGDRKLAGVLIESPRPHLFVIGIGLNVNNRLADAPPELHDTATTLVDLLGQELDRTDVLIDLLNHLAAELALAGTKPEELIARASALCTQRGQWLRVAVGNSVVEGRCESLGAGGELLLHTADGLRRISSGVVLPSA